MNSSAPPPGPLFKRMVLMVVDALREDFLFGSNGRSYMPYTRHLVERGSTHSYVAKARAPTVTMPRIKALTSGSVPGFIDVVVNLNTHALLEDNLMYQAKAAGLRMMFYGDDTWIKLFPKHFTESEGTTSFFVSDYTEVDNNVTRHLDHVLKRDDWDILVLHYLGLDHIGHISGPHSSLVPPKLLEMDDVFKKIHSSLVSKEAEGALPYLLVLCGDHGMSETGSHGGSSDPEVNTALLLVSPAFKRKEGMQRPLEVEQVDLAPSLALGLGLPIPQNSVGRVLTQILEGLSLRDQLRLLHLNGHQLSCLLRDSLPEYQRDPGWEMFRVAERAHGSWVSLYLEGNTSEVLQNVGQKVLKQYLQALVSMSAALSRQLGRYDMYSMVVGLSLVLQLVVMLVLSMPECLSGAALVDVPVLPSLLSLPFLLLCVLMGSVHVWVCTSAHGACFLCSLPWSLCFCVIGLMGALCCVTGALVVRRLSPGDKHKPSSSGSWSFPELDLLLLCGTLGHALLLGSSSFVEEEHQIWYFLLNTLCLALFQDVCRCYFRERPHSLDSEPLHEDPLDPLNSVDPAEIKAWFGPSQKSGSRRDAGAQRWLALATPAFTLLCCRLLRALNQTGVQWAHLPDLGHWFNSSEHKGVLSVVAALCLLLIYFLVQRRCSLVSKVALGLGLIGVYSYRAAIGNVKFPWQQTVRHADKGTVEARFVYVFVLGILFSGTKDLLRSQFGPAPRLRSRGLWEVYTGLVLMVALLFRAHNLPVLCGSLLIQTLMAQFVWSPLGYDAAQTTIMHYWFGQAAFYYQGNSNNIGTVDISVGFVGLDRYLEGPAVILTALSTYAGPLLWGAHLLCYLSYSRSPAALSHSSYTLAMLRSLPCSLFIVLITALRYHLFIWSVFSPKLLYESLHLLLTAWTVLVYSVSETRSGLNQD
ncbi:GPI ethanolamine phosphate transferase 2 [Periophthalmus magnuspinnatus]|uniref:GPI ethanolamine phosphate transferase 2 n=1 Tax=Periophthalmus magnuspinnatus TaxID=409849 RepID=UPI002436EDEB|nr:GPI ethanolamine phosphate transferase 2 [Periophthalmus magnuspinnatus]